MPSSSDQARETLRRFFERHRIADRQALGTVLKTRSRMTLFRRLCELGYLSSYTHAGAYYTLKDIPVFDAHGLWLYKDVGFSLRGTLKETVVELVENAAAGCFHRELEALVAVRVHNTLLDLLVHKRLGREPVADEYLYLSAKGARAATQVDRRRKALESSSPALPPLDLARVVDVLVCVIQGPKDDARAIAARLKARGVEVSAEQVEAVFAHYDVVKKTAPSRSRRSRR